MHILQIASSTALKSFLPHQWPFVTLSPTVDVAGLVAIVVAKDNAAEQQIAAQLCHDAGLAIPTFN